MGREARVSTSRASPAEPPRRPALHRGCACRPPAPPRRRSLKLPSANARVQGPSHSANAPRAGPAPELPPRRERRDPAALRGLALLPAPGPPFPGTRPALPSLRPAWLPALLRANRRAGRQTPRRGEGGGEGNGVCVGGRVEESAPPPPSRPRQLPNRNRGARARRGRWLREEDD